MFSTSSETMFKNEVFAHMGTRFYENSLLRLLTHDPAMMMSLSLIAKLFLVEEFRHPSFYTRSNY